MNRTLLLNADDRQKLFTSLGCKGVDPLIFKEEPDSYPALAVWEEEDYPESGKWWNRAIGGYVYLSDFEIPDLPQVYGCVLCETGIAEDRWAGWGLPRMCEADHSHLTYLANHGYNIEDLLRLEGLLPAPPKV